MKASISKLAGSCLPLELALPDPIGAWLIEDVLIGGLF